jgi:hypothetical protein
MRKMTPRILMALIATLVISAPEGFARNSESTQTAEPIRLTVAPNVSTPIAMKTVPQATCVLHAVGTANVEHSLKLFANDEGMVRFHVRPSAQSDQAVRFDVDCTAEGKVSVFPLHLRSSSSPTADIPAPGFEAEKSPTQGLIRPALTEDEASQLTIEQLAERGYPVRPDPDKAPDAFKTWLKAVTKPSRFVSPRLAPHPDIRHTVRQVTNGFENLNTWSGFELRGAANSYDFVMGEWRVPPVSGELDQTVYSAFWIGLDGDGTSDLVQAGTEQNNTSIYVPFPYPISFDFSTYFAWTEFLPQQQSEQVIPGLTVNAGDLMFCEVWIGNPGSPVSLSGADGIFLVENLSRSEYTTIYTPKGGTYVGAYEAEWIMERPTLLYSNGTQSPSDLADYDAATMTEAYAHVANGGFGFVSYDGANYEQIAMYNGNDLLSFVFPVNSSAMVFYWQNFH